MHDAFGDKDGAFQSARKDESGRKVTEISDCWKGIFFAVADTTAARQRVFAPRDRQVVISAESNETVGVQGEIRTRVARVRDVIINAAPENIALIFKVAAVETDPTYNDLAATAYHLKVEVAYVKPIEPEDEAWVVFFDKIKL